MANAGLHYDEAFLDALPTSANIFTLTPGQFDELHHSHLLSHPPDSTLFPFLHGTEGDNEAQNVFFASEGQQCTARPDGKSTIAKVPQYRAMTWVVCEEDLDSPETDLKLIVHRRSISSYSGDSESYDAEEDECNDDSSSESDPLSEQTPLSASYVTDPRINSSEDLGMDVDISYNDSGDDSVHNPINPQPRQIIEIAGIGADEKHMHPVQHRPLPNKAHIPTSGYSSTEESSETDEIQVDISIPSTDFDEVASQLQNASEQLSSTPSTPLRSQRSSPHIPQSLPPIFTSTFRASELLRRVAGSAHGNKKQKQMPIGSAVNLVNATSASGSTNGVTSSTTRWQQPARDTAPISDASHCSTDDQEDGEWEFMPLRVPEGISLRNFGIQVPILATLSDVIIYSPTANGAAKSPNAVKLAKRFKQALERKRCERIAKIYRAKEEMARSDEGVEDDDALTLEESELPLKYNVFLLDATADDMKRELSHLIVRPCAVGEVPGSLGVSQGTGSFDSRDQDDVVMSGPDANSSGHGISYTTSTDRLPPNTVDLAQREKDEMRDLTRASEIISLFPDQHPLHPDCSGSSSSASTSSMSSSPVGSLVFGSSGSDEGLLLDDDDEVDIGTTKKFWDPTVGQVFLGNASDVPLPLEDGTEWELEYDTLVGGTNPASKARDVYSGIDFGRLLRKEKSGVGKEAETEKKGKMKMGTSNFEMTYVRPGGNAPVDGYGYDICIECHDQAPFPSSAHLKAAEQKVALLEATWKQRVENEREKLVDMRTRGKDDIGELTDTLPPRPAPHPNSVIHLPMPGSPPANAASISALIPVLHFLQTCLSPPEPVRMHVTDPVNAIEDPKHPDSGDHATSGHSNSETKSRRWSSVTSLMASFSSFPLTSQPPPPPSPAIPSSSRHRSFTNPAPSSFPPKRRSSSPNSTRARQWSRPLKVLVYSSDGYTESSLTALCLLMAFKSLDLPHAYLELQVNKRRSFFVYQMDLGLLRRVEEYMLEERKREKDKRDREERERREREREWEGRYSFVNGSGHLAYSSLFNGGKGGYGFGTHINPHTTWNRASNLTASGDDRKAYRSQVSKSVSFAHPPCEIMERGTARAAAIPMSSSLPTLPSSVLDNSMGGKRIQRPRARTSPWLPSLYGGDHQNWFNDPRFDGSFPSRVLPFLYLGNLNHASNVYMLQALGITHVVSVGECALIPPPSSMQSGTGRVHGSSNSTSSRHYIPGKSSDHQGSLWIEERAGRIKVLDIQGVCDDGIDTLEPQLEPICDWIDEARQEGGQVLVHCRVGVSRSATVTIAYVMKHLSLPLVDAYLIVRSRRLSVLIQPNMRLLYNLLGWEIKLAKERAGDDERKLRHELSSALTWPYLAKEVHALNEKYLN